MLAAAPRGSEEPAARLRAGELQAHLQVVVHALQVWLLQLGADVLRDQVDGHRVLIPARERGFMGVASLTRALRRLQHAVAWEAARYDRTPM